jgi:hypothetical protein
MVEGYRYGSRQAVAGQSDAFSFRLCNYRVMKVTEFAQIIDAYPAPGRTHWIELWSLDQKERFMLRLKGSAKLSVGNIVQIDKRKHPKHIQAMEFSKLPPRLATRTVMAPVSFKPLVRKPLVVKKPTSPNVDDAPAGTTLHRVYEADAVSEAVA